MTVTLHVASVDGRHDANIEFQGATSMKYAACHAGEKMFGLSEPPNELFRWVLVDKDDWAPLPDDDVIAEYEGQRLLLGVVPR